MERVRGPDEPVLDPTLLDQARQLEHGKDIVLTIPNTFFMQMLFKGMEVFRKMLGRRSWVLVVRRSNSQVVVGATRSTWCVPPTARAHA